MWPNPSVTVCAYISHHSLGVELQREFGTFLQCKLCIYKLFCEVISVSLHMSVITQYGRESALTMAVREGRWDVVSLLLKAGAVCNIDLQNEV